jgi:hypothetical protein
LSFAAGGGRQTGPAVIRRGERLPGSFLRRWTADALSAAGDGFTSVAALLLLTTLTDNPVLVAGGVSASQVPWLLFGLHSGAVVDRSNQRRLIMRVDIVRAMLMTGLAVSIATGSVSVALLYILLLASGAGDTLVLTAGTSLVPVLIGRTQLTRANGQLMATRLGGGFLIARPVGTWPFTRGHATPFFVDAVSFLAGALLMFRRPARRAADPTEPSRGGAVRAGLHIQLQDRVLRVLALSIVVMNVTLSGTLAVLVAGAGQSRRLNLRAVGTADTTPDLRSGLDALEHSAVALRAVFRSIADRAGATPEAPDPDRVPEEFHDEDLREAYATLKADLPHAVRSFGVLVGAELDEADQPSLPAPWTRSARRGSG